MTTKASSTASSVASQSSNRSESTGSPRAPIASEVSVTPSCIAAMKRGGSLVIRCDRARRPAALVGELLQPRPAHGHERVLGRDEEAVQQNQRADAEELEERPSCPVSRGGGTRRDRRPLLRPAV